MAVAHTSNGQSSWRDVSPERPCPICGHDSWCSEFKDGVTVNCRRQSNHPTFGNGKRGIDKNGAESWLFRLKPSTNGSAWPAPKYSMADFKGEIADPDTRNRVYSRFLELASLQVAEHKALEARGVDPHIMRKRGFVTLDGRRAEIAQQMRRDGLEEFFPRVPGFHISEKKGQRYWSFGGHGGLLIPVRDPQGRIVALKCRPIGSSSRSKYVWVTSKGKYGGGSPGSPIHIPQFEGDRTVIRITEGPLKAELATLLSGILTIGLPGVAIYKKVIEILRTLGALKVRIALDADFRTNPAVARALVGLATLLAKNGFEVELETWDIALGKGIDDLLAAKHAPEVLTGDAAQSVIEALHASTTDTEAIADDELLEPAEDHPKYFIADGCLWHRAERRVRGEIEIENLQLTNFVAEITDDQFIDDGSGSPGSRSFVIVGTHQDGSAFAPATVKASNYATMGWVPEIWGARAIIGSGYGYRDHTRAAIQTLSTPRHRTAFSHTGWTEVANIGPLYLHAGGAIGRAGVCDQVDVLIEGPGSDFLLPPPPTGDALKDAIHATLRLWDFAPLRIVVPLLGATFRVPLGECDHSVHLVGPSGCGKSESAALMQQHFGPSMVRMHLPGSWSSTENSLEATAFLLKDSLFAIDDFKPSGSRRDDDALHLKADRVLRAQGNRSGRGRCATDGSLLRVRPPRGLILSCGEDSPRGESLKARFWEITVAHGEIDILGLTPFQTDAINGLYAGCMAAYVRWLAVKLPEYRAQLQADLIAMRMRVVSLSSHARTPGVFASLMLGIKNLLDFAMESGVIAKAERDRRFDEAWRAMIADASVQAREVADRAPAARFVELIHSLFGSGRCYLRAAHGGYPDDPEAWGWRATGPDRTWAPSQSTSECIGWIKGDDVYLNPVTAYAEARRLADNQNDPLPVGERRLRKELDEAGLIASKEQGKLTQRVTLGGAVRTVLHLRLPAERPPESAQTEEFPPIPPVGRCANGKPGEEKPHENLAFSFNSPYSPDSPEKEIDTRARESTFFEGVL